MKLTFSATDKSHVARDILAYLAKNPDARDTVEGIVEWWLLEQKIEHQTALVKDALGHLVARGLVIQHVGEDARTYYALNRQKLREISVLLNEADADGSSGEGAR